MAAQFPSNQLQFNLDVPVKTRNMAAKFRSPQPIFVEKLGVGIHTPLEMSYSQGNLQNIQIQKQPAFEFSTLSEDRLSMAVRMARRDLQKKRQEEIVKNSRAKSPAPQKRTSKKKIGTSPARNKLSKRQDKVIGRKKEVEKKKKSRPTTPVQAIIHVTNGPAVPCSPPTRDTDPYAPVRDRSQDGRMLDEITRLRNDMHTCMVQIQQIEQATKAGSPLTPKPLPGTEDLPPAEQKRRRALKAEENATRSARTLYSLQQQVHRIQEDLKKCKKQDLVGAKKSKYLSKLAAAYRAAVRALQVFVNQLPDTDLSEGLPRAYREFVLIVRQLSLCCAQLEIAGESGMPESVTNLLQDMANMNEAMELELRGPDKRTKTKVSHEKQSRQLYPSEPRPLEVCKPERQSRAQGKENRVQQKPVVTSERQAFSVQKEVRDFTPDRQSALKRGIEALLRTSETPRSPSPRDRSPQSYRSPGRSPPPPDVPRLAITPRTPRAGPYNAGVPGPRVAWDLPPDAQVSDVSDGYLPYADVKVRQVPVSRGHHVPRQRQRRAFLIPSALQQKRANSKQAKAKARRGQLVRPAITGPSHYAEPTMSTMLKKVHPHELPKPEFHPPQPRHGSPSPPTSPRSPRRVLSHDAPATFADPTFASALKVTHQRPKTDDDLPPFLPTSRSPRQKSTSPRRDGTTPRRECMSHRHDPDTPGTSRREYLPSIQSPRTPRPSARSILSTSRAESPFASARRDIAKQVFMDRKSIMKMKAIEDLKSAEKARFSKLKANLNETDEWVRETERRIRDKIQPLLENAQEINRRFEELRRTESESDGEGKAKMQEEKEKVECNADVLSDMLMHDILEETVYDIQTMEDEAIAEDIAWHMQQAPSIGNLVKRLQEMEEEQDNIRQKWATIVYEDENRNQRASYFDAVGSDRPGTPPPIQLTKVDFNAPRELTPTRTRMMRVPHPHEEEEEPEGIYFTRESQPKTNEYLHLSTRHHHNQQQQPSFVTSQQTSSSPPPYRSKLPQAFRLTIPPDMMENIRGYSTRYEAHLRRTANNPIGNFDPWKVVDEVAGAILSDCLEDIARELEEINSDVVNHVYQSEFQKVPDEETPR